VTEIKVERTKNPKARPSEDSYGFGRYFSDHMFMTEYAKGVWSDARIQPYQSLALDPGASVLHYGQALFEGMKAFRGVDNKIRLFRAEKNWARMCDGAERLCMQMPSKEMFLDGIKKLVTIDADWVPTKPGTALYLRPTLIGTEGFLGVRPSEGYLFYVIASPVGGYYGEGIETVKIWVEREYSRAARGGIGAVKAGGNYASSLLAAFEAKKRGYAQVLWLDASEKKYVEEVGTMNVFFHIGDSIITPPLGGTILPGVMRDSIIELLQAQKKNLKVEERRILIEEVLQAQKAGQLHEIFGSGTAASVSPVGALGIAQNEGGEDTVIEINQGKVGPLANELFEYMTGVQYGRRKDDFGWTQVLEI
jgi:branched-chain amino acid aminotransferase